MKQSDTMYIANRVSYLTRAVFHSVRLVSPQGGPRQWLDHWSNDHESSLGGAGC